MMYISLKTERIWSAEYCGILSGFERSEAY